MEHTSKTHKSRKTAEDQVTAGKPRKSPTPLDGNPPPVSATTSLVRPSKDDAENSAENSGPPAPVEAKKQWWYRAPDSKTRKLAAKIAVLDAAGHQDKAIAKKLNTTPGTIQQARYLAKKNGWWDENDEAIDLETELALNIDRKIVRNIDASLDGKMTNWQTHEMTIAAAKGRGVFKNHESTKSEATSLSTVEIKMIMPVIGSSDQVINDDMVGGVPAFIDVEPEVRQITDGE